MKNIGTPFSLCLSLSISFSLSLSLSLSLSPFPFMHLTMSHKPLHQSTHFLFHLSLIFRLCAVHGHTAKLRSTSSSQVGRVCQGPPPERFTICHPPAATAVWTNKSRLGRMAFNARTAQLGMKAFQTVLLTVFFQTTQSNTNQRTNEFIFRQKSFDDIQAKKEKKESGSQGCCS